MNQNLRYRLLLSPELVGEKGLVSTADWTAGTGWAIAAGVATCTGDAAINLSATVTIEAGATYRFAWHVATLTRGDVRVAINADSDVVGTTRTAAGWYTEDLVASDTNHVGFLVHTPTGGAGGFLGTIDYISIRKVQTA